MLKGSTIFSRFILFSVFILVCFTVTACGIKPAHVDPPQGRDNDTFPKTYPDPSLDPKPVSP